jgi:hypothetical protein
MAVPKKSKRGGKHKQIFVAVAVVACLNALFLYSGILSVDQSYFLTSLAQVSSVPTGHIFEQKERQARAEQDQFCRDLDAGRIELPKSQPGSHQPVKTRRTLVKGNYPWGNTEFSVEIYDGNDIVSDTIKGGDSWDNGKVVKFIDLFVKYAKEHNLSMSDLTFVDIGANVGWFSYVMAGMGVNVIAFEPMEQNLYLIRKTLCNPDNSSFRERIVVFPTGLSDETKTCILFSGRVSTSSRLTLKPTGSILVCSNRLLLLLLLLLLLGPMHHRSTRRLLHVTNCTAIFRLGCLRCPGYCRDSASHVRV